MAYLPKFFSFSFKIYSKMVHFEDLRKAAYDAENDLNSYQAKQGLGKKSDSSKLPAFFYDPKTRY